MTTLWFVFVMTLVGGAFGMVVGGTIALSGMEAWSWGFVVACACAGAFWGLALSPVVRS